MTTNIDCWSFFDRKVCQYPRGYIFATNFYHLSAFLLIVGAYIRVFRKIMAYYLGRGRGGALFATTKSAFATGIDNVLP